ncbi:MAG TPA: nitrate reductase [Gammaproteobacteria bacterium]|nr:nitrate reductase [Gammaproteobacteria bacterium]
MSVRTTCPYCGVGCGVIASLDDEGVVVVSGDPDHPANEGRLCSKGTALGETVYLKERLLYPEIAGKQVSWEQAIATTAGRFAEIVEQHGPDAVAFYVSGQLLTEDYYVANKLMKGFLGSANIDTNSRLCMSSAVAGYKRAFGEDVVPCSYDDLDRAKMIVITGSNTAWCHPVIYQRIVRVKKANPDLFIVLIDPRKTQTSSFTDLHLAIRPGTDATLFNGLLAWLDNSGEQNEMFTRNCTKGLHEALSAAQETAPDIASVARECGLREADVSEFFRLFARTERVVTLFSQGINQSSSGVDKVNSIINCHLFTGRIGRPGMGPFSLTGQPNAMGGREVGGLANQLAAHMDIDNPVHRDRVQRFWGSPVIAQTEGLKAVDLFQRVATGEVKAVWIMATNPVVSMPEADQVKAALEQCELVVVSDCVRETDTVRLAHIRLPALAWGEKDGTVTNSERRVSRARRFLPQPGQARPDWWIVTQVARKMGFSEQFSYESAAAIFSEHAALSTFENNGERLFDIGRLAKLSAQEYQELAPVQWPINDEYPEGKVRLYGNGKFSTGDEKARFIAVMPRLPESTPNNTYPFVLNTGRVRDHWHTMTRTGMSPRLSQHVSEPYVEVHPDDIAKDGFANNDLVMVSSPHGNVFVRLRVSEAQQKGSIFIPMHWNAVFSSNGRVGALVKAVTDPISGQPESKHSIARLEACQPLWHGFILTRRNRLNLQYSSYWARSRGTGLWRYEIAGRENPADWGERAHTLLSDEHDSDANWVQFFDKTQNHYRAARFIGEQLESCIFIGASAILPERDWLISLFLKEKLEPSERQSLLTGKPPPDHVDVGRIVCACFNVGEKTIKDAIEKHALTTPEQIGELLQAGTNCGSCIPELRELLK